MFDSLQLQNTQGRSVLIVVFFCAQAKGNETSDLLEYFERCRKVPAALQGHE